ncbi:MAG: type II toxin-antitoxin system mRNA interferase toxin, RelE/StbE family [Richelia sp. RM2_1_2]|nr:type II toxin-antitoxin system mRNA interferase toxin, RelE/StbE family [Richelia sp. RM2_1_2]
MKEAKIEFNDLFLEGYNNLKISNPKIIDKLRIFIEFKKNRPPKKLPNGFKDHKLKGKLDGFFECHLDGQKGNVLLIYTDVGDRVVLIACCDHNELKTISSKIK